MNDIVVTRHASKRIRKREGLSKSSVDQNARTALEKGLTHADTTGSLNRYITYLYFNSKSYPGDIRIYNQHVYIIKDSTVITVLPLPHKYHKVAKKLQDKKNAV